MPLHQLSNQSESTCLFYYSLKKKREKERISFQCSIASSPRESSSSPTWNSIQRGVNQKGQLRYLGTLARERAPRGLVTLYSCSRHSAHSRIGADHLDVACHGSQLCDSKQAITKILQIVGWRGLKVVEFHITAPN